MGEIDGELAIRPTQLGNARKLSNTQANAVRMGLGDRLPSMAWPDRMSRGFLR
jgi:hypothetical protein